MSQHFLVLAVFLPMILGVIGGGNSSFYSTEAIVTRYGFPIETHKVTTTDGYILTLHRLRNSHAKKVIFLMHGLLCSSSDWVLAGPERALAFLSYLAGYDVWLGNARGNTYSRNHTSLDPDSGEFWNFGWHEIGLIDLPAMILYALEKTGAEKLVYVGHSQGTTAFFALSSILPDFNKYFESAHMLSPAAFMSHLSSPFVKYGAAHNEKPIEGLPKDILGKYEVNPDKKFMEMIANIICKKNMKNYVLCSNALFLDYGFDENTVADGLVDGVMETTPAGASTKQFLHYVQLYNSGEFRQFDYGLEENLIKYQQTEPPNYPLANIDVPIYLYYGDNDALIAVKDVEILISELPVKTVKMAYRVPDPTFDHLGQLYNANVKALVYDTLLNNILT